MSLKAMYNEIAEHYDLADQFGALSQSHQIAIDQIKESCPRLRAAYNVLDLGVGNASFLVKLKSCLPDAHFTGVDISGEMLAIAQKTLPLTTIETSASEASHFLPPHSQDLVLAHFINAYIPIDKLFHQADRLTKASGHFSLITTTYDSFPQAQHYLAEFITTNSLLSRVVGHYYKSTIKNTTVAGNLDELVRSFEEHRFHIVDHQRLSIPITLNNIDELVLFGIEGTWFLNSIALRMLPKRFLIERIKRLFANIFTFPYHDTHIIDVILARK